MRFNRENRIMVDQNESGTKPLNKRQRSKIETRQKVIDAGRKLFMEGGYDKAVIRDIAKEAGMSTGAVFANFEDKADLLLTLAEQDLDLHKKLLDSACENGTVLECIMKVCAADFAFFKDRLHMMEALTRLETLVEPEAHDPYATSMRARAAGEKRRKQIQDRIWCQLLDIVECGPGMLSAALAGVLTSIHRDRCREAAIAGWEQHQYRNALRKDLKLLLHSNERT